MHSMEHSVVNKNESSDNIIWKEVSHNEAMIEKKKEGMEKDIVHEKYCNILWS